MRKIFLALTALCIVPNLNAQLKIGSNNYVGAGIDNPAAQLHVKDNIALNGSGLDGSIYQRAQLYANTTLGLYFDAPKTSQFGTKLPVQFNWRGGGTPSIYISGSDSKIGMWKNNPSYALDVNGDIATYGTLRVSSDERMKENIVSLNENLVKLKQINGFSYNLKKIDNTDEAINDSIVDNTTNDLDVDSASYPQDIDEIIPKIRYGVLAQEVKEVFPELVDQTEDGYYNVDYIGLIPVLIEAVKEQQEMIEELKGKIDELSKNAVVKTASIDSQFDTSNTQ